MRPRIVFVFALTALTCGLMASPAAAKGPDPCKVFKKSEIAERVRWHRRRRQEGH